MSAQRDRCTADCTIVAPQPLAAAASLANSLGVFSQRVGRGSQPVAKCTIAAVCLCLRRTVEIYLKNRPEITAFVPLAVLDTRICTWPDSCHTRYSPLWKLLTFWVLLSGTPFAS